MIGIYKITNLTNGKIYIGQSTCIEERLKSHMRCSTNIHLRNSVSKYGKDNFKLEVLEECDRESLNELERKYIKLFNSDCAEYGYNLTSGGERESGWNHSEESIHRMKELASKRVADPDYVNPSKGSRLVHKGSLTSRAYPQNMEKMLQEGWELGPSSEFTLEGSSKRCGPNNGVYGKGYLFEGAKNHFYGKHHTEETKEQIRQNMPDTSSGWRGHHHTEESKQKMRGPRPCISGEKNPNYGKRGENSVCYGRIGINNGKQEKRVKQSDLAKYLTSGWTIGGLKRPMSEETKRKRNESMKKLYERGFDKSVYASGKGKAVINNGCETKRIPLEELETYLCEGWKRSRIK